MQTKDQGAPRRFHLDPGRLAARVLATEGATFGFDRDDRIGRSAAVASRFADAQAAGAIRGPADARVVLYPLGPRALMVAVRESPAPADYVDWPCRQLATYAFDADEIAPPGDACFGTCLDGLGELLERANALLEDLDALRGAEAAAAA
jgi:hypothetical protein